MFAQWANYGDTKSMELSPAAQPVGALVFLLCYNITSIDRVPASGGPVCQGSRGFFDMRLAAAIAIALVLGLGQALPSQAADGKIVVVAAENAYGDIARQLGADRVDVTSILTNPSQDPHLFETAPGTVRKLAAAQIVVLNGADYDPWMDKLLKAGPRGRRPAVRAAGLT